MRALIRRHWPAFVLALLVASLTAFPQVVVEHRMGTAYQGIHPLVSDDEIFYQARAHETLDGHPTLGNPYFAEDKANPTLQFWIPDTVLAHAGILMGDLHRGVIFWDFVFGGALVLVSYAIVFFLTGDTVLALVVAAVLDPGLFFYAFNRSPNPQLFTLLLFSLYGVLRTLRDRKLPWAVVAGVAGGTLFYIYPYYWTYWIVFMGLSTLASFVLLRREKSYLWLMGVGALACVIGIPYFLTTYASSKLPYAQETFARFGVATHVPSGFFIVSFTALVLALFALLWWKRLVPRTTETILVVSVVAGGALVTNQHVVTGMNYLFTIHYTPLATYLTILALSVCALPLIRYLRARTPSVRRAEPVLVALVVLGSLWGAWPDLHRILTPQSADVAAQRYAPVLSWLDAHTPIDASVYADDTLSLYIPAYTHDNVYYTYVAFLSYLPNSELYARFVGAHYFDASFTREDIIAHEAGVFGLAGVGAYQHGAMLNRLRAVVHLPPLPFTRYPEAEIATLLSAGTQARKGTFTDALGGYHAEYLVWDRIAEPEWQVGKVPGIQKVFEGNDISVYQLP